MSRSVPIGIDLGTTNSAVAWVHGAGHTEMLANEFGDWLTPSAVFFTPRGVTVGREAIRAAEYAPEAVIESPKRFMGQVDCGRVIHGHAVPPELAQAFILRQLRHDIDAVIHEPYEVVITVPAFFDEVRRQRTVAAGEMAGLKVLDVINEPTAAALAFGEHLGFLGSAGLAELRPDAPINPDIPINIMVYDLGGGTFDVTVICLKRDDVRVLASDGDVLLGGLDWDRRLVDYAAQKFESKHFMDPREDPETLARLMHLANEAKHSLVSRRATTISVNYAREQLDVEVSRETFSDLNESLVDRTMMTVRDVMSAAGRDWTDLDHVLLVGGATRMPQIAAALERETKMAPRAVVNPDEAVARGAAVCAATRLAVRDGGISQLRCRIVDVSSHSLGIQGIDRSTDARVNSIIIPRNSPLPAVVTRRFVIKEKDQNSIAIRVLEGELTRPEDCIVLGKAVLRDLPENLGFGQPVDVTYEYDSGGRLGVQAALPGTEHRLEVEFHRDQALDRDDIQAWRRALWEGQGQTFEQMLDQFIRGSAPGDQSDGDPSKEDQSARD